MSVALRTSLRFFEIGVVATACSLASAVFVELIMPSYDASRNRALQALEGILGMTLHYLLGLELFLAAYPLSGLYPATVFAVLTPVMVPSSLAKMSSTMSGLSRAIAADMPYEPDPSVPLLPAVPVRPKPGTVDFEQWLEQLDKRLASAALAMRQELTALTASGRAYVDATGRSVAAASQEYTDERADALLAAVEQLRRDTHLELVSTVDAAALELQGWTKSQALAYKQKLDARVAGWDSKLTQLEQNLAQQVAAIKSNFKKSAQCRNHPGNRMIYSMNNPTPRCGNCPGGYSWQPVTNNDTVGHDTNISLANEICKPDPPPEPVVVVDPGTTTNGFTWDNPAPGVTLARGTVAFTGDPRACEKFYMSLADPSKGSDLSAFFDACGRQYAPALALTNPNTGATEVLEACVTGLLGKDGKAGTEERTPPNDVRFYAAVKYPTGKNTVCNKCMACNRDPACSDGTCAGAMKTYEKQNSTERVACDEDFWSEVTGCK